jgi:hypothetical protein
MRRLLDFLEWLKLEDRPTGIWWRDTAIGTYLQSRLRWRVSGSRVFIRFFALDREWEGKIAASKLSDDRAELYISIAGLPETQAMLIHWLPELLRST